MNNRPEGGFFISFEGIEGSGKTTQARLLSERLVIQRYGVVLTQEPGGTPVGSEIREILLEPDHREMSYVTELLLYNAARAQHLSVLIRPSLSEGKVVITDRFSDSTVAYQGFGRGIDLSLIEAVDKVATGGFKPDITILLDLDPDRGLERNRDINKVDRLELEDLAFHARVRDGFLRIAEGEPARVAVIDASLPFETVRERVWEIVRDRLQIRISK